MINLNPSKLVWLALPCLLTACPEPESTDETGTETSAETGDGDGDLTGDGDGDPATGDGDGDLTGDGDGDLTGDGDGDTGPVCGDGVVEGDEACDLGDDNSDDGECTSACQIAVCGDNLVHAGVEACDDGNTFNDDGCLADCTIATTCQDILLAVPMAPSGAYVVDLDSEGPLEPATVYCDMETDGGGWMMVFKISSGVGGNASELWAGGALNTDNLELIDLDPEAEHYVSGFIDSAWNQADLFVDEVRIHTYNDGAIGTYFMFDGVDSTASDWLAKDRLLDSPFTDIVESPQNYFSLEGHAEVGRTFFINRSYGNCPNDRGWLVVDAPQDDCLWESNPGDPLRVLYATGDVFGNWNDVGGAVELAELMAVFIR